MYDSYNKTNYMHQFLKFIFGKKFYMFRTVLFIIRSSILILLASCHQTYMTYTIVVCTVENS